jgi:hypothetical protein
VAPLLRRRVALLLIVALAAVPGVVALALPAAALAGAGPGGSAVLADFDDNGRIDACYSRADFRDALRRARADQRLYGVAIDVIQQAQATNVAGPDGSCAGEGGGPGAEGDDGDVGIGLWIGVVVALGLVAAGAGVLARRNGDADDDEGAQPPAGGAGGPAR